MFKFVHAPFDSRVQQEVAQCSAPPHSALVWETDKRITLLSANVANSPESRERIDFRLETTCEFLNACSSGELVKEMIRSIRYTNEMGEKIRAEKKKAWLRPKPFYPSFTGHGGSGFDSYW